MGGPGGFCEATFAGLPVEAAAKTGTSQVQRAGAYGQMYIGTNGFLISYAPADNPEIAVAVAIEGAESGTSVSPVAADIYSYYFGLSDNATNVQENDTLLG